MKSDDMMIKSEYLPRPRNGVWALFMKRPGFVSEYPGQYRYVYAIL